MNQRLTIDLKKNTSVADLIADMEPGDKIDAVLSIVAKDDQTLTAELVDVMEHDTSTDEAEAPAEPAEAETDSPAMQIARGKTE